MKNKITKTNKFNYKLKLLKKNKNFIIFYKI